MAIYLAEDEVGFDANKIGFPTLGSCMGLAVQNGAGLYGFHIPPGHNERSTAFADLYAGQPANLLISCARWNARYDGAVNTFLSWLAEVQEIAGLIGYSGQVMGFNLSTLLGGNAQRLADGESAYCEFTVAADGSISIGCSLTSNTQATKVYDTGTTVRRINANKTATVPYKGHVFSNVVSTSGGFTGAAAGKGTFQVTI